MPIPDHRSFLDAHVARVDPLSRDVNLAYWKATISGQPADFNRYSELEVQLQKIYAGRADYEAILRWLESSDLDPLERRQLDLLRRAYLRNQVDPALIEAMTRLSSRIVHAFGTFRANVGGKSLTGNDVRNVLRRETDPARRRRVWEADKSVGREVINDLLELVRMRNEVAHSLGFSDYYTMSLELSEQHPAELAALFDRLDALTSEPFERIKNEIDGALASRYGIAPETLRPWHYEDPYFQESPRIFDVEFDRYYLDHDVIAMAREFYEGIGLEVSEILARSDLYEKAGKDQHAYCIDIDRKGDVRVLANVQNDENWAGTMLHELGHAAYDRHIDPALPYLLREHAHVFATEAIAMLFGRLSKDAGWIECFGSVPQEERARLERESERSSRLSQLVFARWCQVMVRFERALYADPGQDLNRHWWDLVECYQLVPRPERRDEPDWAAKIHIVSAPVYYHNYMLGELFASQLDHSIQTEVLRSDGGRRSIIGQPAVGEFLRRRVFAHGKRYPWDELVARATGEALSPEYFAAQYVS